MAQDYEELVRRLRGNTFNGHEIEEAADALEAQARELENYKADFFALRTALAEKNARITALEGALRAAAAGAEKMKP